MRIDRVVSRLPLGTEHVCSLLVEDEGLYVIHTGDENDLPGYLAQDNLNALNTPDGAIGSISSEKTIEKGEKRLEQLPLEQLAAEAQSTFVNYASIQQVNLTEEALSPGLAVPVVQVITPFNEFIFLLPSASRQQAQALADGLEHKRQRALRNP